MTKPLEVGVLVEHSVWGLGKVMKLAPPHVTIYFKTLEATPEGPQRKLSMLAPHLSVAATQSDPVLDLVDPDRAGRASGRPRRPVRRPAPRPLLNSLDQAVDWFREEFPGQFADPEFIRREITYKREAHDKFVGLFGNGKGERLIASNAVDEIAGGLSAVYHATNIPSRFELMAVSDGLKDYKSAARVLKCLLAFLKDTEASTFAALVDSIGSLPARTDGSRVLTWPNVTILPFLADPSNHMVLKPQITRRLARRLQFDLLYSASLSWHTYEALGRLSESLLERLAPLGAKDYIDVQSFIWVTTHLD